MKKLQKVLTASLIVLMVFTSNFSFAQSSSDDVYYSPNDPQDQPAPPPSQPERFSNPEDYTPATQDNGNTTTPDYSTSETRTDGSGNTYITNNYYGDDYYDYEYSARLRRFYSPVGLGYYNTFYTNSYWYDYNPASWGVSIYLGYNWWRPPVYYSYYPRPSSYFGFGFGSFYDPWYSPGYSYWSGYSHGYNNGYWDGYMNGYYNGGGYAYGGGYPYYHNSYNNPYYFNSYDNTSYHYGPRKTSGGSNYRASQASLGEKYLQSVEVERIKSPRGISNTSETINRSSETSPARGVTNKNELNNPATLPSRNPKAVTETKEKPVRSVAPVDSRTGDKPVRNNPDGFTRPQESKNPRGNVIENEVRPGRNVPAENIHKSEPSRGNVSPRDEKPVRNNFPDRNIQNTEPSRGNVTPREEKPVRSNYPERNIQNTEPSRENVTPREEKPVRNNYPERNVQQRENFNRGGYTRPEEKSTPEIRKVTPQPERSNPQPVHTQPERNYSQPSAPAPSRSNSAPVSPAPSGSPSRRGR